MQSLQGAFQFETVAAVQIRDVIELNLVVKRIGNKVHGEKRGVGVKTFQLIHFE